MFSIISNCSTSFGLSSKQTLWAPLAGKWERNRLAFALCRNIKNAPSLPSCSLHIDHNAAKWRSHCRAPAAAAVEPPCTTPQQPITPSTHHANKTTNWILIIFEQKQTSSALPWHSTCVMPMQQILKHYKNYKMPRVILLLLLLLLLLFREFVTKFHAKVCDEILDQWQRNKCSSRLATPGSWRPFCHIRLQHETNRICWQPPHATHHPPPAVCPFPLLCHF